MYINFWYPMIRSEDVTWTEATGGFRGFEIVR